MINPEQNHPRFRTTQWWINRLGGGCFFETWGGYQWGASVWLLSWVFGLAGDWADSSSPGSTSMSHARYGITVHLGPLRISWTIWSNPKTSPAAWRGYSEAKRKV